jgi:hypothetical protein
MHRDSRRVFAKQASLQRIQDLLALLVEVSVAVAGLARHVCPIMPPASPRGNRLCQTT